GGSRSQPRRIGTDPRDPHRRAAQPALQRAGRGRRDARLQSRVRGQAQGRRLMEEHVSFWSSYLLWRDPVIVAMLAAAVCAYCGVFIVLKRVVFVSAALSSMSGVGVACAFYLASVFGIAPHAAPLWLDPRLFALVFAALGA